MNTRIRLLSPADAEQLFTLRHRALLDSPYAFSASPEDDRISSVAAAREQLGHGPGSVVIGAFADGLVGMLGMYRLPQLKTAHIVYIWGVFVAPQWRGHGLAKELLEAAIAHARTLPDVSSMQLSVNETTPGAQRVYESVGFRAWGVEPDALRFNGRSTSETRMSLALSPVP